MKALLDTHTFLWAISANPKLSKRASELFTAPSDLWLSVASLWEILVKVQIGKIPLPTPTGPYLLKKLAENKIEALPLSLDHVLRLEAMPMHHRDPFDRMLIAQSLEEGWPIITADPVFKQYPVRVIW
jgi:PIN domain nuclease of toxin-antitoxin system